MKRDLSRLFRPKSIAVIGGGAWCRSLVEQCLRAEFEGDIYPIHPKADMVGGVKAWPSIASLPVAPDASFIGVNRHATIEIVGQLETIRAGGAICFASGFLEAIAEDVQGADLQDQLLEAAGDMPILGPNCYGFVNYLDKVALWPDQHGGIQVDCGVAIITQSSNMAINLTMQNRGLPLAYIVAAGNQAQTGLADLGEALLEDERVTALGLHIEGFGNPLAFEKLARRAVKLGKPIVALKVGKSEQAQQATISHTASLAGGDAGASALLARFGIARIQDLPGFLEALKLLHVCGPLKSNRIASVSCSGGEASLAADTAAGRNVVFPRLNSRQSRDLREALGPMVALANPLDYHTYIWRDAAAMTRAWAAIMDPDLALTMLIVDFPRPDRCDSGDWDCAIEAATAAKKLTGSNVAMVASLPELMPEEVAQRLIASGVVPLNGLGEAITAVEAAVVCASAGERVKDADRIILPGNPEELMLVSETDAKARLAAHGVRVPLNQRAINPEDAAAIAEEIDFPVVLKGEGVAHKTEAGAVILNLQSSAEVLAAAKSMSATSFLVEEMISDTVTELLIGVVRDPAHGFVLTLAAGGVLTELLEDSVSLIVPASRDAVTKAIAELKVSRLLEGFRGKPAADQGAVVDTVMAVQEYVQTHAKKLGELEINPLLCCADKAIVADILMRQEMV